MNFKLNEDGYAQTEVDGLKFEVITIGKSMRVKLLNDKGNTILGDACDVFEADHIIDQYVLSKSAPPRAQFNSLYLAAAGVFAAKTDVRYYLNGVYIEPLESGGVNLVGTDGHRMLVIHDPEGWANRPFILPHHSPLFSLCKKRPRYKRGKAVQECVTTVLVDDDMVYAMKDWYRSGEGVDLNNPSKEQVHRMNLECSWPFKEVEGRYPDWRRVVPKPSSEPVDESEQNTMCVNPEYVGDLMRVQQIIAGKGGLGGVMAKCNGIHQSMMFRFGHHSMENVLAIIMPMRIDPPAEFVPAFCK